VARPQTRIETLERCDIQALILRAYVELRDARYYFLQIQDPTAFKAWLATATDHVTTAASPSTDHDGAFNLAFTRHGLSKLGVDPLQNHGEYDGFGLEFKQGMITQERSRFLGDVDQNDPARWSWGGRNGRHAETHIDCLCLLYANGDQQLDRLWLYLNLPEPAATVLFTRDAYLSNDNKEHFGFRDGIAQPTIRFTKRDYETTSKVERALHVVEAGEFILGYENENLQMPVSPGVTPQRDSGNRLRPLGYENLKDFGRNGTYLVLRQLRQHVERFEEFLRQIGGADPVAQERLAARLVGRWRSGAPLTLWSESDPWARMDIPDEELNRVNNFTYDGLDRCGYRCPVGAHIRRGNPRDTTAAIDGQAHALDRVNFHRLLRRGRLYGPRRERRETAGQGDGVDRGLMFLCLNADLRRQFEFVQQTWMANNKFGGLLDERDPLVGPGGSFTVQRPEGNEQIRGLQQFVTVEGGAYFFMPGIQALRCLAD